MPAHISVQHCHQWPGPCVDFNKYHTISCNLFLQTKSRLELSLQTLRTSHQKEMESREEEMDQLQSTMNKKVKSLENQLEDALEEKHSAVKVCSYKR